jgi:pantoate--beta-alanine ligase
MPIVLRDVATLRATVAAWRGAGESIALVPTMGALHAGHLSLVNAARAACRRVVVSIFVNPTQFGPSEDFTTYPRDEAGDLARLGEARADAAFMPDVGEMYRPGAATSVTVAGLGEGLCGAFRPGHFTGVATVVTKLLLQAQPDAALFGEKDYQQLLVIRRLAMDLDIPARIIGVPTLREADGLAMSSRNLYLTPDERRRAPRLHHVLGAIAAGVAAGRPAATLLREGHAELTRAGFAPIQYLELRDAETLRPEPQAGRPARVLAAAYLGRTRLIDNLAVPPRG